MDMIKPPRLKAEATIGIISPSYYLESKIYKRTVDIFIQRGFNILKGDSVDLIENLYSGSPVARAQDIMKMFANPKVDAIICARGGYGANRVLPLLDYDVIKANPKIFIGYSDITALLTSITQKTGLVTFHGPMLVTYKNGFIKYNYTNFIDVLSGKQPLKIEPPNALKSRILKAGKASGRLWGGNLCLLLNRLGTPDQLQTDGAILFIEDIGEQHYRFDRMIVQMRNAGMFDKINGLIIGELVDMQDTDPPFGKTTDEIIMDVCGDLNIPIMTNFPCGHGKYQTTLPLSINAELDATSSSPILTILEPPVE